jgi:predicted CXXCH cytochrome family protein
VDVLTGDQLRAVRLVFLLAACATLTVLTVQVASADGGPHGGYTGTTDACAGCHRTHQGAAPKLLVAANTNLCLTCHGPTGTGSNVDVSDGIYRGTTAGSQNAALNSGGFTFAKQDTSLSGKPVSAAVTSMHQVQGMPGYSPTAMAWGAGAISTTATAGQPFDLYCTSCHDPHGSKNYRLLRTTVNGKPVSVTQTDETTKDYTTPHYYKPTAGSGQWEIASLCGACHTRYVATASGSGETSSTDILFAYRHRIEAPSGSTLNGLTYTFPTALALPVSTASGGAPTTSPDNRSMVCLTCHYAHGTTASMGKNSGAVAWPGGASGPTGNGRSSLLRLDNRGVCENCHAK